VKEGSGNIAFLDDEAWFYYNTIVV
jgi:hypothetical protein